MNHLIDTNVLLAASAYVADDDRDVTPQDPRDREKVYHWLDAFVSSNELWIVDGAGRIIDEYHNKQSHQDFSLLALLDKQSRSQVLDVEVEYDRDGFAVLPSHLAAVKWDNSDKKFVAAGLQMVALEEPIQIVNASDTDWYDVANALDGEKIGLLQLIDDWCRAKYRDHNGHEPP